MILAISGLAYAKQIKNATTPEPRFLSIQTAQSGSISQVNTTSYILELNNVSDKTIMFADRPDRIVTYVSTGGFISNWTTGMDSFESDPPNAVLVLDDMEQRQELAIIELSNPEYTAASDMLKYDIILENATSIYLPDEFGESTLVIDDDNPHHCDVESGESDADCGQ